MKTIIAIIIAVLAALSVRTWAQEYDTERPLDSPHHAVGYTRGLLDGSPIRGTGTVVLSTGKVVVTSAHVSWREGEWLTHKQFRPGVHLNSGPPWDFVLDGPNSPTSTVIEVNYSGSGDISHDIAYWIRDDGWTSGPGVSVSQDGHSAVMGGEKEILGYASSRGRLQSAIRTFRNPIWMASNFAHMPGVVISYGMVGGPVLKNGELVGIVSEGAGTWNAKLTFLDSSAMYRLYRSSGLTPPVSVPPPPTTPSLVLEDVIDPGGGGRRGGITSRSNETNIVLRNRNSSKHRKRWTKRHTSVPHGGAAYSILKVRIPKKKGFRAFVKAPSGRPRRVYKKKEFEGKGMHNIVTYLGDQREGGKYVLKARYDGNKGRVRIDGFSVVVSGR